MSTKTIPESPLLAIKTLCLEVGAANALNLPFASIRHDAVPNKRTDADIRKGNDFRKQLEEQRLAVIPYLEARLSALANRKSEISETEGEISKTKSELDAVKRTKKKTEETFTRELALERLLAHLQEKLVAKNKDLDMDDAALKAEILTLGSLYSMIAAILARDLEQIVGQALNPFLLGQRFELGMIPSLPAFRAISAKFIISSASNGEINAAKLLAAFKDSSLLNQ